MEAPLTTLLADDFKAAVAGRGRQALDPCMQQCLEEARTRACEPWADDAFTHTHGMVDLPICLAQHNHRLHAHRRNPSRRATPGPRTGARRPTSTTRLRWMRSTVPQPRGPAAPPLRQRPRVTVRHHESAALRPRPWERNLAHHAGQCGRKRHGVERGPKPRCVRGAARHAARRRRKRRRRRASF